MEIKQINRRINPAITVLLPVYNAEKYLKKSIESILSQSFSDFEILIINDGSTDNSLAIIHSFHDSRISIENNSQNKGIVYSLNLGIKLAKGEYIARMDADDIAINSRLAQQIEYMRENSNIDICGSWLQTFKNNTQGAIWKFPRDHDDITAQLLFSSSIMHPTAFMRKSSLNKYNIRYEKEFEKCEDYALWVSSFKFLKFHNIQAPLLLYRLSSDNMELAYKSYQQTTANRIRYIQLKNLGIEITFNEEKLHYSSCIYNFEKDAKYIKDLSKWFSKILEGNSKSCIYNREALARLFNKQLTLACLFALNECGNSVVIENIKFIRRHNILPSYLQFKLLARACLNKLRQLVYKKQ